MHDGNDSKSSAVRKRVTQYHADSERLERARVRLLLEVEIDDATLTFVLDAQADVQARIAALVPEEAA